MKALLSIKPEFVEKIFSGEKCFEFRKAYFKRNVDTVVIYATMPVGKIVGEFQIGGVLSDSPTDLWESTKEKAGISMDFFHQYFSGKDVGYAIQIKNVKRYKKEKDPFKEFPNFTAPQSFMYISQ